MKLNRRGFLKGLPSAPFLAQDLKRRAARLTGAKVFGGYEPGELVGMPSEYGDIVLGGTRSDDSLFPRLKGKALAFLLRQTGLPDWKKQEIRRDARRGRRIDPDLAALRSISNSAALQIQWQRNEERMIQRVFDAPMEADEAREFRKKHNTDWF